MSCCDKCGLPVHRKNDATFFYTILTGSIIFAFATPRHLLPVTDEDGKVLCEGSPSRAQYLEGQPRDTRGYEYRPEVEAEYRAAYAKMQEQTD